MLQFDKEILYFINDFANRSLLFDIVVVFLTDNNFLKGGILIAVLWGIWFDKRENEDHRKILVVSLLGSIIGVFIARFLADILPVKLRPIHDPNLFFNLPYSQSPKALDGWSTFPSDHAVLYFSIAAGIFLVSRLIGSILIGYVLIFICFPRVYTGLHYPTDIIGGVVIGFGIISIFNIKIIKNFLADPIMKFHSKRPGIFYALFFILTYQITTLFSSFINLLKLFLRQLQNL